MAAPAAPYVTGTDPSNMSVSDGPSPVRAHFGPADWERIVREQQPRVHRLAYRLTGTAVDADDLTHDVFVRIFASLHTYTDGNFDAWVSRITVNLCRDRWRRRARIVIDPVEHDDLVAAQGARPGSSTEDAWEASHLDVDVARALCALPAPYRAAIVLCDVEGMGHAEAADLLGVRQGTVRSRLHRGRAALRESLAHRAPRRGALALSA